MKIQGPGSYPILGTDYSAQPEETATAPLPVVSAKGTITMIDPEGKEYELPASSYKRAIETGWRVQTPKETALANRVRDQVEGTSGAEVFGKNLANEALLGVPDLYKDLTASPDERSFQQKVREKELEAHPIAGYAGKILGFAAPLAIPGVGEVGEAARLGIEGGTKVASRAAAAAIEKEGLSLGTKAFQAGAEASLARKVAASSAKYATEGAIYSTPQAAVQATYGDPEKAAETMLWGIGLGGVLGGTGRLVGEGASIAGRKGLSAASDFLSKEEGNSGLSYLANVKRKNIYKITDAEAKNMGAARTTKLMETADQEGLHAVGPEKYQGALEKMQKDAGTKIGDHINALSESNKELQPIPAEIANKIRQRALEDFPQIFSETHSAEKKLLDNIIKDVTAAGSEPSFAKTQEVKKVISSIKNNYESKTAGGRIARMADDTIREELERSAQRIYDEGASPEKFSDYIKQKDRYWTSTKLLDMHNEFTGTGKLPSSGGHFRQVMELATGHPVGAAIDLGASYAYNAFRANKAGLLGKSINYLQKLAKDPQSLPLLGGLMAKEGATALETHLDSIPQILSKDKVLTHTIAALNPIQHIIGDTTGLSTEKQYERLTQAIQRAAVDTNQTAALIGGQSSLFTTHNTQLGYLVAQKKLQAVNYLTASIPKGPAPKPFQRDEWTPTKQQQQDFLNRVKVVNDPMSVWKHYQDGTLSKTDRETLQAVYPKIYQEMVNKLMSTAYDPRQKPLSHEQRIQLSMFTGMPLDKSLSNIAQIQASLAPPPPPQSKPTRRSRSKGNGEAGSSYQTPTQRRTYK